MTEFGLDDVKVIEGEVPGSELDYYKSLQRAINSGHAWKMQGSYGRSMMGAIEAGKCMLGLAATNDYWGNRIPSRNEVKSDTKGGREFVAEQFGEEWAKEMEAV